MYIQQEIVTASSIIIYLKYILATDAVTISTYNYTTQTDVTSLTRVNTLSATLFDGQFSVDDDKSAIYICATAIGSYLHITYYTNGIQNPYYASSNLNQFINQVLRWTSNRIVDGIFLLNTPGANDPNQKTIQPGSFVYNGQYYAYQGGIFNVRDYAPPMIKQTYKGYLLCICNEIIESWLDVQSQFLNRVGVVISSTSHSDMLSAKTDVDSVAATQYSSTIIEVAYVYAYLTKSLVYESWISYPNDFRSL